MKTGNSCACAKCSCNYDSSTEISAAISFLVLTFASEPRIALKTTNLGFWSGLVQQIHNETGVVIFVQVILVVVLLWETFKNLFLSTQVTNRVTTRINQFTGICAEHRVVNQRLWPAQITTKMFLSTENGGDPLMFLFTRCSWFCDPRAFAGQQTPIRGIWN